MINTPAIYGKSLDKIIENCLIFDSCHSYQFRLMSDEELLAKSELVYTSQLLKSKVSTLDSAIFGATEMNSECEICHQRQGCCAGHFAVLKLSFPIPKIISIDDFKTLIHLVCPICSHLYIPEPEKALELPPEKRLDWVKNRVNNYIKDENEFIKCSFCKNDIVPVKIIGTEPTLRFCIELNKDSIMDQINPIEIYKILQNFNQPELIGFSENYHPKNFMTYLIPIVPAKLRPKTNTDSDSSLTGYYKNIIEKEAPELDKLYKQLMNSTASSVVIKRGETEIIFNQVYDRLMAYYMLITSITDSNKDKALDIVEKRDRQHFDGKSSLLNKLKGKDKSIFSKGIIAARHNISARTVLGGAFDSPIKNCNVPYHIANKLRILYPVYEENIKFMQQLVASMANLVLVSDIHTPIVQYIIKPHNRQRDITYKNATEMAALLKPGDQLAISLLNGDFVMSSRFPSIREESWNSMQVLKDNNTIVTLPLATIGFKMGDFDGDEAQIYANSSHYLDIESLLLHSTFAQYIEYKSGNPGIWFPTSGDAYYGFKFMVKGRKLIIRRGEYAKEYDVIDEINSFLPKDLNYKDKRLEIRNGKVLSESPDFKNAEFFKYYATLYSNEKAEELMDNLSILSYDLLIDQGAGAGFEIKIIGKDTRKKIQAIIDNTTNEMIKTEMSNNKHKDLIQILNVEKQKVQIKQLLIDAARGTNIDKAGYTTLRQEEYYQTVVMKDHIVCAGTRIQPTIGDGSRTCTAFPRYSIDPRAYGFAECGYNGDLPPFTHFYDVKQERATLYEKGQGTAKQGYLSKRLGISFGNTYVDFNGALVNNFRNVSTMYNCCGLNPRLFVKQPLIDADLDRKAFVSKYEKKDKRLIELYDNLHECRERYNKFTCFTKSEALRYEWIAGFNYEQYINSNVSQGETEKDAIEDFIQAMKDFFKPPALKQDYILENFKSHEYYFRIKLLQYKCNKVVLNKLFHLFKWTLCDGGEPAGMKAALAITEPLTQASLHAIHHHGGGAHEEHIVRSAGVERFQELIGENTSKNTVVTFVLYDDSKEASVDFANEQETFYFCDVWTRMELCISKTINKRILKQHSNLHLENVDVNNYFVTSIWYLSDVSTYNIHIVDIINKLMENYNEIAFITGWVLNSSEFMAYIYFKPNIQLNQIQILMEEWRLEKDSCIIHGKYLKNCYVSENVNRPGHYIIEANEVGPKSKALENLILDERIDPMGCKSNSPTVMLDVFGIFEASTRLYEELIFTAMNLSDTSGVLQRHYKAVADDVYVNGDRRFAARESVKRDRTMDTFKAVQFETAKEMIRSSLKYGDLQPIANPVSATVFGELANIGTGVSKITLYAK